MPKVKVASRPTRKTSLGFIFLEMMDILNEQLVNEGVDPVAVSKDVDKNTGSAAFDHIA